MIYPRRQAWFASKIVQIALVMVLLSVSAHVSVTRAHMGIPEDWTHHRVHFNTTQIRQHPEIVALEPRAALHLYREAMNTPVPGAFVAPFAAASSSSAPGHRDWSISLGAGFVPFGQFPAKWRSDPTLSVSAPNCSTDYVIFPINAAGATGGQATLVGLTNLYSGGANPICPGGQPLFLFSFNTSTITNGRILTSPVLSLDGKRVAFMETAVNNPKSTKLHVLTLPTTVGANGTSATASVAATGMTDVPIVGNSSTRSSPWVDYAKDILYVAADDGKLYRVLNIFNGTPTLDTTAPWPKTVNTNSVFTSPTLDPVTGNAFLGAGNGRVYSVNVNTPGTVTQIQIGTTGNLNAGVLDSPFIDVGSGTVFAVSSNDTTSTTHGAVVVQASTSTLAQVSRVHIGLGSTGGTSVSIYDGDFENAYFVNPSTGHLLMCGTGAADTTPQGYLLGFDANSHLLPDPAPTPFSISTNANARCGPITEYYNTNLAGGPYDFFFWGVTRNCVGASGCIMSRVNGGAGPPPVTEVGGTSGIIIDNDSTQGGASSIYFSSQQNPRNAVKLTQLNLN